MRSLSTGELPARTRLRFPAGGLRTCQKLQESDESDLHTNVQAGGKGKKRKIPQCESHPACVADYIKLIASAMDILVVFFKAALKSNIYFLKMPSSSSVELSTTRSQNTMQTVDIHP